VHLFLSSPSGADPLPQLLNTFSNLGGTWPRYFVLKGVDHFSRATCQLKDVSVPAAECVSDHGKAACGALGGTCVTEADGYYAVSAICLALGALSVLTFIVPTARRLEALPLTKWRVSMK
jgi:PAT family acetyl-CoA transporter-like MFS transporter 1